MCSGWVPVLSSPQRVCHCAGRSTAAGRKRDPTAARVRPVSWGLTAALVGTLAANAFYLTMTAFFFYGFIMLVLALPVVFGRRLQALA